MLYAKNLGIKYGTRWVFRHINFELKTGDCLLALGPNGSGKSTLLKSISGLIKQDEGEINYTYPLGYAALDVNLYPSLSAREHLYLCAKLKNLKINIDDNLKEIGLINHADKPTEYYSSGMKARLKLALATIHQPEILLLDEPTATLDTEGFEIVEKIIHAQKKRGALILATNDSRDHHHGTHEIHL